MNSIIGKSSGVYSELYIFHLIIFKVLDKKINPENINVFWEKT